MSATTEAELPSGVRLSRFAQGIGALLLLATLRVLGSTLVLSTGFRAVSDDDYARVVIAQGWAQAPAFDASGTSWLPLPFWTLGTGLRLFGRGLGVAQGWSLGFGVVASWLIWAAARELGLSRRAALLGACVATVFPWSLRLGVATVPELWTSALTVYASCTLVASPSRRALGGLALLTACLSRYEPWFVVPTFATFCLKDAWSGRQARWTNLVATTLALLGPTIWMGWNGHRHGSSTHFLARVTAYKQALGAQAGSQGLGYVLALPREEPELVLLSMATLVAFVLRPALREDLRRAFWRPAVGSSGLFLGLCLAGIRDGAPTHHPERALLTLYLLGAVLVGSGLDRLIPTRAGMSPAALEPGLRAWGCLSVLGCGLITRQLWTSGEQGSHRQDEVEIGLAAAAQVKAGTKLLLEVRDYGYLATTAAFGRPEDTVPDRDVDPRRPQRASSFTTEADLRASLRAAGASAFVAQGSAATTAVGGEPRAVRGRWQLYFVNDSR